MVIIVNTGKEAAEEGGRLWIDVLQIQNQIRTVYFLKDENIVKIRFIPLNIACIYLFTLRNMYRKFFR